MKDELKNILEKYNLTPNKLMGQNFLVDQTVLGKIIEAANLSAGDSILEIGPGLGILTEQLVKRADHVLAVEKDKHFAEILKEKFASQKNVEIIEGDILSFLRKQESRIWIPGSSATKAITNRQARDDNSVFLTKYKVVANIPYYLTSHLIRELLESNNPPQEMILMIQKEVAQRICAQPPKMSLLSIAVQFYAQAKIIAPVSKTSFWPQPKVDSAIIKIIPHKNSPLYKRGVRGGFEKKFFTTVKAGFLQPRKQLTNNLSRGLKIDREKINETLKKIGLAPQQRAETLDLKQWTDLAKLLN